MFPKMFSYCSDRTVSTAQNNNEETHPRQNSRGLFSSQSRTVDSEQGHRDALLNHIDTLCAADKSRNNAVLERLGRQNLQPPIIPGQMTMSASSDDTLSFDASTPTELREIPLITTPDQLWDPTWQAKAFAPHRPFAPPPVNPQPRRRVSRIPVMQKNSSVAEKNVAGGYRLQTAEGQVEKFWKGLQHLHQNFGASVPHPPTAPRRKDSLAPIHPAPPPKPAPSKTIKRKMEPLQPAPTPPKTTTASYKPTPPKTPAQTNRTRKNRCTPNPPQTTVGGKTSSKPETTNNKNLEELKPLCRPLDSLSLCFKLMVDEDWEKRTEGLKLVQALAQHHPDVLKTKLHEVSYAVTEEIKNLRSSVAAVAIDTMVYMFVYLHKDMNVQAEKIGNALLLKIAQSAINTFMQQQTNIALEALVHNCNPAPVLNALLNTGLSHLCLAVREGTAQHIRLMADIMGTEGILTSGKTFIRRFVVAVNKMAVDSSSKVRAHGLAIFQELKFEKIFMDQWKFLVSDKDKSFVEKHLKNMRMA